MRGGKRRKREGNKRGRGKNEGGGREGKGERMKCIVCWARYICPHSFLGCVYGVR